jgi:flavin reductase (DIM6/NTAB) family NADH-FMN oxidoreductase RutF
MTSAASLQKGQEHMNKISIEPEMVFCPQPMYLIGTRNEDGRPNFCIITWISFVWHGSPHIVLSVGGSKKTKDNLLRERAFAANLISTDLIWLADYLGCSSGYDGPKDKVPYSYTWGQEVAVPVLDQCRWAFECRVSQIIELDGSHIFISKVENIQIDSDLEGMDREKIDLRKLDPAIYAPYNYYRLGEKLGDCGEWAQHIPCNG